MSDQVNSISTMAQGIEEMGRKLRPVIFGFVSTILMWQMEMVQAADNKGHFAFRGIGGQTCKIAIDQMQKDSRAAIAMDAWLMGYLTAANREQSDTFDISPVVASSDLLSAVIGLCRTHPDMPVESAFNGLLRVLSVARNRLDSPLVETKSGKNTALVRTETLIAMQIKLVDYGYLKGKPDGAFGAKSELALKAFQRDQKLPESGVADGATVIRLLIELPAKKS